MWRRGRHEERRLWRGGLRSAARFGCTQRHRPLGGERCWKRSVSPPRAWCWFPAGKTVMARAPIEIAWQSTATRVLQMRAMPMNRAPCRLFSSHEFVARNGAGYTPAVHAKNGPLRQKKFNTCLEIAHQIAQRLNELRRRSAGASIGRAGRDLSRMGPQVLAFRHCLARSRQRSRWLSGDCTELQPCGTEDQRGLVRRRHWVTFFLSTIFGKWRR